MTRIFPYLMSKLNSMIDFRECRFNVSRSKEKTARISLWKEMRLPNVFTLEASFFGYKDNVYKTKHYNIQDYLDIGKDICINLSNIMHDENGDGNSFKIGENTNS